MNIGNFSRLSYDDGVHSEKTKESTDPVNYKLHTDQIYNCNGCLSTLGPRTGNMGYGVSTIAEDGYAVAQNLVDLDSVLSNRNVQSTKLKRGKMNPINPTTDPAYENHKNICNNTLNPQHTRLSNPNCNYRGDPVNRFYNTIHDPQANIFWNFAKNTSLEAKDNYYPDAAEPWEDGVHPVPSNSEPNTCQTTCSKGFN